MFCHIVPCVYLKSWKIKSTKNSIYIFEKDKIEADGVQKNISNLKGTGFGEMNFYYLKIESCNNRIYDNFFYSLFTYLNNDYVMEFKGNVIVDPGMFRIIYLDKYDDLVIKRKIDNKVIDNSSIIFLVNKLWNNEQKKYIENFLSREVESKWNIFLSSINQINDNFVINNSLKEYIMLFISTQLFRNGKIITLKLNELLSNFNNYKERMSGIQNDLLIDTFYEFIHDYDTKNLSSTNIIYNTFLNLINSVWNYTFYINNGDGFLVSDNPIFVDSYLTDDESIFLPISPKICLQISLSKNHSVNIKHIDSYNVRNLNSLIIKNSTKNIAFYEKNIDASLYK